MSVRRQISFALGCAGVGRAEAPARVAELLEWVELAGFEQRMPASLSGGEGQRLALARALAASPRLLLLDEPLGPLDAELREALLDRLEHLRQRLGFGSLHVTHDPASAARIATRCEHLRAGLLEAPGPKEDRA